MTDKNVHWLHDGGETSAVVAGADERDHLRGLGWTEAEEPTEGFVYIWRDGIAEPGRVHATALRDLWGPRGWVAGPPPGGTHPFAPKPVAEPAAPKSSKSASSGEVKEKSDG